MGPKLAGLIRRTRRGGTTASDAERDLSLALTAAVLGTLLLGSVVGVESHWELLLLLAVVAGVAIVFDVAALHRVRRRPPRPK